MTSFEGSELHYNMFESMISGRDMYDNSQKPVDKFRQMFKAQLIKDVAMAHRVNELIKEKPDERYFIIAGYGHMKHYQGVPERVFAANKNLIEDSCLIVSYESDYAIDTNEEDEAVFLKGVTKAFGPAGSQAADLIFIYDEEDDEVEEQKAGDAEQAKAETAEAYNKVGASAHLKGDSKKAKAIMTYLGYSEAEFELAGQDAYNYQGVGNPHLHAKI